MPICSACEVVRINGVVCHEVNCPRAWEHEKRKCKWCGFGFVPTSRVQSCCSESCYCALHGFPDAEYENSEYEEAR